MVLSDERVTVALSALCGAVIGYIATKIANQDRKPADKEDGNAVAPTHAKAETASLPEQTEAIIATLKRYEPVQVEGMDPELHYMAPHIPRAVWRDLGNLIVEREKNTNLLSPWRQVVFAQT